MPSRSLAGLLEGRVLVAPNLDRGCVRGQIRGPIPRHHVWEASENLPGLVLDQGDGIDTMPNPLQDLGKLCVTHGITLSL